MDFQFPMPRNVERGGGTFTIEDTSNPSKSVRAVTFGRTSTCSDLRFSLPRSQSLEPRIHGKLRYTSPHRPAASESESTQVSKSLNTSDHRDQINPRPKNRHATPHHLVLIRHTPRYRSRNSQDVRAHFLLWIHGGDGLPYVSRRIPDQAVERIGGGGLR